MVGTVAIAYSLGSNVGFVRGDMPILNPQNLFTPEEIGKPFTLLGEKFIGPTPIGDKLVVAVDSKLAIIVTNDNKMTGDYFWLEDDGSWTLYYSSGGSDNYNDANGVNTLNQITGAWDIQYGSQGVESRPYNPSIQPSTNTPTRLGSTANTDVTNFITNTGTSLAKGAATGVLSNELKDLIKLPSDQIPSYSNQINNGYTEALKNNDFQKFATDYIQKNKLNENKLSVTDKSKILLEYDTKTMGTISQTGKAAKDLSKKGWWSTFYGNSIGRNIVWAGVTQGILFGIESLQRNSGEVPWDVGAAHTAVGVGTLVGVNVVYGAVAKGSTMGKILAFGAHGATAGVIASALWGVGIALVAYELLHTDKTTLYTFNCYAWQAPEGGKNCDLCNTQKGDLPCTEYQCRSLGQGCEMVNKGTEDEKCVWINRDDVNPPQIRPWNSALISEDYSYDPLPSDVLAPGDIGVEVLYKGGKIKAFTPLSFGIQVVDGGMGTGDTNPEPAICKIDYERKDNFDDMRFYLSDGLAKYNHSYSLTLPSIDFLESEGIVVQNGGTFNAYVRCKDSNGNVDVGNFVFRYTVDDGPDTTPPIFRGNSFTATESPVAYNTQYALTQIYINEPAECRWDHRDTSYEDMGGEMTCSESSSLEDLREVYICEANLTGIKNGQNNNFYFRCSDQPWKTEGRNTNSQSYHLNLIGTQPLVISSVSPNDTLIKDASTPVKVMLEATTTAGYNEGDSVCYFSNTGEEDDYTSFPYNGESGGYFHSQELWLQGEEGGLDYTYYIKCIDDGGNVDREKVDFSVETDNTAPRVTRVYHDENYLKILTDEKAECVYDVQDCTYEYDAGNPMTTIGDTEHFTDWNTESTFYIKCRDDYGNSPEPDVCSIIARPSQL